MPTRNDSPAPPHRPKKLIVVMAFKLDDEGELVAAFDPIERQSEGSAKELGASIAHKYAGVIAWSRSADPDLGEFGEPEILFQRGQVPEMD